MLPVPTARSLLYPGYRKIRGPWSSGQPQALFCMSRTGIELQSLAVLLLIVKPFNARDGFSNHCQVSAIHGWTCWMFDVAPGRHKRTWLRWSDVQMVMKGVQHAGSTPRPQWNFAAFGTHRNFKHESSHTISPKCSCKELSQRISSTVALVNELDTCHRTAFFLAQQSGV